MFIKITVFLIATALFCVLVETFRLRSKSGFQRAVKDICKENDNRVFAEQIVNLTKPQLESMSKKFERELTIISSGFISMKPAQQQKVIARVTEIKEKIHLVKKIYELHKN